MTTPRMHGDDSSERIAREQARLIRNLRAQVDDLNRPRGGGPQRLSPAQADALLARNRQRAPGLGPQGQGAMGRGNLPPEPHPINPAAGVFNAQPVSPAFQTAQNYVALGAWQPGAGAGAGGNTTTVPLGPSVDDTPTLPGQVNPQAQLPTPEPEKPKPPTPAEKALQSSLRGVSVRLDRLSDLLARNVPTPGGVAPLVWTLLILLAAVVPVSAGGATRLKLLWEVITGTAFLPGVQYGGVLPIGPVGPGANDTNSNGGGGSGGGGSGSGGLGDTGRPAPFAARGGNLTPLRVPTSLPLGDWGAASRQPGPVRIPGRATAGGGHHSRVAATLASGQRRGTHGGIPASGMPNTPAQQSPAPGRNGGTGTGLSSGFGPTPRPAQPLRFGPRRAADQ